MKNNGKLISIPSPSTLDTRGDEWTQRILDNIGPATRVVAMPHVHWSDGTLYNLGAIREKLDQYEGYLVIDGTQSIGALPFSVKEIRPDVLAVASYKWLLGPYGLGLAYYNERFSHGTPIENSWINRLNSEDFARLVDYQDDYRPGAFRYSVGESSNFIGIPIMEAGIKKILEWGVSSIQDYTSLLLKNHLEELKDYGFLTSMVGQRGNHLFGIKIPDQISPKNLAAYLMEQNIYISVRGSFIRVSPYLYNTADDIKRLKMALIKTFKHL
jgi:selenocysteine lyase/cysteine desulfurase